MAILIVGADRLGNINREIYNNCNEDIIHWTGRTKIGSKKYVIPNDVSRIFVFCDFINHNLMHLIKKQAKRNNVQIFYSRRSMAILNEKEAQQYG
ncbi:DUF2325 domain-containing protein [Parasporobacterium paucivorans]|uniref:DUF2325 domain-containing protein n=1 Tax=Parasporobacterium paucivorans DSM 15970 TaxID=1122934 RepID=A0A1M6E202_9FIRM|nr:DUF2325 domain-containing protein [Parasporobacterium paucivorans]SHI79554.1 hypothetical protein SAMN02745691_00835 [Parasporobacterium paucivorans DSM 15970]